MVKNCFIPFVSFLLFMNSYCHGYNDENTVLCADGLGSVKYLDLCNYQADCHDASDELHFNLCKVLSEKRCGEKNKVKCSNINRDGGYDNYWSNRCTDIITACKFGSKCFSDISFEEKLCNELPNGRLKVPQFRELSKLEEEKKEDEKFPELMKFIGEAMNETMERNFSECPPFFTPFDDDKCVSLFTPIQISWFEARMFCESLTGSLIILDNIDIYIQLLKYIQEKEITSRFWIGAKNGLSESGNSNNLNKGWTWINGKPVTMGVPYWSLFTFGTSEPFKECQDNERKLMPRFTGEEETCLSILNENYYYFSDEFCTDKFSPLCFTNKI